MNYEDVKKAEEPIGPEHQWFAWKPVWTTTGWKWLKKINRQRWRLTETYTYFDDPSMGNGGGDWATRSDKTDYWVHGSDIDWSKR